MNWFYFIDKPLEYSSFDIVKILRKKLQIKKIGHTWTLDPLATGGLLVAVWNYTKLIPYLEKDTKEYEFTINFDWETESFDLWTDVNYFSEDVIFDFQKRVNLDKIRQTLKEKFTWKISQVAPKYSAKKINGQRAYNLARAWKEFKIKANNVEIFTIEVINYTFPKLTLKAKVSAGTYIRSIAYDLAIELWLSGSYVSYLRRIKIWKLDIKEAQKLDNFDKNIKIDPRNILKSDNFIVLDDKIKEKIDNWLKVVWDFDYKIGEDLFVLVENNITNIIEYDGIKLIPKRKI